MVILLYDFNIFLTAKTCRLSSASFPMVRTAFHFHTASDPTDMFSILAIAQTLVPLITLGRQNLPDLECWANQSDGRPGQSPASPLYRHYLRRILFQSVCFMVGRCASGGAFCLPRCALHPAGHYSDHRNSFSAAQRERQRRLALFA